MRIIFFCLEFRNQNPWCKFSCPKYSLRSFKKKKIILMQMVKTFQKIHSLRSLKISTWLVSDNVNFFVIKKGAFKSTRFEEISMTFFLLRYLLTYLFCYIEESVEIEDFFFCFLGGKILQVLCNIMCGVCSLKED